MTIIAPTAPKEAEELAFLIGDWNVTCRYRDANGTVKEFSAISNIKTQLGGYAYVEELSGDMDGLRVDILTYRSYSTRGERWHSAWLDTLSPSIWPMLQLTDADEFVCEGRLLRQFKTEDAPARQLTLSNRTENSFHLEFTASDARDQPIWSMDYVRKTDDDGTSVESLREQVAGVPVPPETAQFNYIIGHWDAESVIDNTIVPAVANIYWLLGGHAFVWNLKTTYKGQPDEVWDVFRYNTALKCWENLYWATVQGGFAPAFDANFNDEGITFDFFWGGTGNYRDISDDSFVWYGADQEGKRFWQLNLKRRKS